MAKQCPLIFRHVDANLIRINTAFVTIGVMAYLITHAVAITMFLTIDFALRLYGFKHLSPVQFLAARVQGWFSIPAKMEDAGAKRLAAFFGLGFMIALTLSHFLPDPSIGWIISGIYLICAIPYLTVGYCVGCQIYYIFKKIFPSSPE